MSTRHDIAEIFANAVELPPSERQRFLELACDGSESVKGEVESLLREHDDAEAQNFLSKGAFELEAECLAGEEADERVGQTFGRYKVIRRLGTGGMGAIYLAGRTDDFEKQAAVKIIKRGMDTDAIIARFRNERQILASLDHPNIAGLIDGGTTPDGLPFFVLEYIDGVSIADHCRGRDETEILRLFLKVCSAVSFAHQKLIVHRDLKPSNILINPMGEPKLLDFGIAKLLDSPDVDITHTMQRLLTPAYAAPEQISGGSITTAVDVYSLGKVLAKLLSGDNDDAVNTCRLGLSGDLQNIISTAMSEDTRRRYASVDRFSDDIERYLGARPVSARKPSLIYTAGKFIQRNRVKVALAGLCLAVSIAGLSATLWKAAEARRQRVLAERRFENLRKLSDSFVTELHGAIQNLPGSLPARRLLLKRATEQLDSLARDAGNDRQLNADLATAYYNLSSLPDMEIGEKEEILKKAEGLTKALVTAESGNAEYAELLAHIELELADVRKVRGSAAEGLAYASAGVELLERTAIAAPAEGRPLRAFRDALALKTSLLTLNGRTEEALAAGHRTLELSQRLASSQGQTPDDDLLEARVHLQMGHILTLLGRYDEALAELDLDLDAENAAHVRDPNDTSIEFYRWAVKRRIAVADEMNGRLDVALDEAQDAMSIMGRLRAGSPTDIGYNRNSAITEILIGRIMVEQHRARAAIHHFENALRLSQGVVAADPEYFESGADVARATGHLGHALYLSGRYERALPLMKDSLERYGEMAAIDSGNATLQRDYAETAVWAADAFEKGAAAEARSYRELSISLWQQLEASGHLRSGDSKYLAGL